MLKVINHSKASGLDIGLIEKMFHFATNGQLTGDVTINIIIGDATLDKLSVGDYEMQAILYRTPMLNVYSMFIRRRPATSLSGIVFHEATHLLQYESGRLSMDASMKRCSWEGEEWPASTPYMSRPWEVEAFKEQRRLEKAWRKKEKEDKAALKAAKRQTKKK